MASRNVHKRRHDVIDLTDDSPSKRRPSNNPTTQYSLGVNHSEQQETTQAERDSWLADDINIEDVATSQQEPDTSELWLYGTLSQKIVGVRFYRGIGTAGERVLLKREPGNPYDRNAIRVDNVESNQIGHIPKKVAEKLARYFDNRWCVIEGALTGGIGEFDAPIDLKFFGPKPNTPDGEQLMERMKADKLPLHAAKDLIKAEKDAEKERQRQEKAALADARRAAAGIGNGQARGGNNSQLANQSQPGFGDVVMADILENTERFDPRRAGESAETYGQDEKALSSMPLAKQPEAIKTTMLPYQLQALQWLLNQEDSQLPAEGSKDIVQLWKRHDKNKKAFFNVATNHSTLEVPVLAKGGILADDMGLGKTLEMISLLVADNVKNGKGTTLIVAPLSVMSNWTDQMAHHVHEKYALKSYVYHGKQAVQMKTHEITKYDVVITTYQTLASDHSKSTQKGKSPTTGLYGVTWRRVILDEGHIIRNPASKGAAAVMAVDAKNRWVLTGTPIVNTLKDLFCLLKFVGIRGGLNQLDVFNSVLVRPLNHGDPSAVLLLKAIMKSFTLRRKKEMSFIDLKLPPLEEYLQRIEFTKKERERYTALEDEAKGVMKAYVNSAPGATGNTFQTLLEILLRMRQCCNHYQLCGARVGALLEQLASQKIVKLTSENTRALQDILQIHIESQEDCAVCLETLHDPVITHCGHSFGRQCIARVIEAQKKCPMCRAEIKDDSYLVAAYTETGDTEAIDGMEVSGSSSKLDALLKILEATKNEGKGEKTIIFSQWTKFLDIVQSKLDERGFMYTRLDGTMKAGDRDAALHALENDDHCTIMLASLGVCAVGLNLVAANNVILSDSWWAPAVEDQAVDRVHRLGQQKATRVFRLVMDQTIEDTVLDIQEKKRGLMKLALSESKSKRDAVKQGRLADIQKLLGWKDRGDT